MFPSQEVTRLLLQIGPLPLTTFNRPLIGFTLTNGFTQILSTNCQENSGGGVRCEPNAMLSDCFIIGNRSYFLGGGVYGGILRHCSLVGNQGLGDGATSYAVVENCVLYS